MGLATRLLAPLLVAGGLLACAASSEESGGAERAARGCEGVSCNLEALLHDSDDQPQQQRRPWRVLQAESFRVLHFDDELATRLAREAEGQRLRQLRQWLGPVAIGPWSPRCDIYLYPTNEMLVKLSGGGSKAGSALTSPSRLYRGRIMSRRIDLAADDRLLFERTLPHEVSHVVLNALLPQQVPSWAHEGLATLEEPPRFQRADEELVAEAVAEGRAFSVKAVMEMSRYPDQEYVHLFYAQSFSLTRFLVGARGRPTFLAFLRALQPGRVEAALRFYYGWGYPELQQQWTVSVGGR
jgi:hypothetical protein